MKKQIPSFLLIAIIFAGAGFFGGMKYQQGKSTQNIRQQFGGGQFQRGNGQAIISGQPRQAGNRTGGRAVAGEILSQDEKSLTVKLPDGGSKIVLFSETTTINKATQGTKEDLKTGEQVIVSGTENPDGSVTAKNISLGIGRSF